MPKQSQSLRTVAGSHPRGGCENDQAGLCHDGSVSGHPAGGDEGRHGGGVVQGAAQGAEAGVIELANLLYVQFKEVCSSLVKVLPEETVRLEEEQAAVFQHKIPEVEKLEVDIRV